MQKIINEFKEFISKGNVLDLAVGVIIGSAFGKIVTSIVNDILMPIIGILIGGIDFTGLTAKIGEATIKMLFYTYANLNFVYHKVRYKACEKTKKTPG